MPSQPILYSFRRCPYAMRARMALILNNITVELREVVLKDKPTQLLACSPKATVPVLVISPEFIIEESREIIDWSIQHTDFPTFDLPCQLQRALVDFNDNEFKGHLDRYKYFDRFPEQPQSYYRQQATLFLEKLEQQLIHTPYLFGEEICYADIAIFPFIRQFSNVENGWLANSIYQNVQAWLERLISTAAFTTAMHRYPQWQEDANVVTFPPVIEV